MASPALTAQENFGINAICSEIKTQIRDQGQRIPLYQNEFLHEAIEKFYETLKARHDLDIPAVRDDVALNLAHTVRCTIQNVANIDPQLYHACLKESVSDLIAMAQGRNWHELTFNVLTKQLVGAARTLRQPVLSNHSNLVYESLVKFDKLFQQELQDGRPLDEQTVLFEFGEYMKLHFTEVKHVEKAALYEALKPIVQEYMELYTPVRPLMLVQDPKGMAEGLKEASEPTSTVQGATHLSAIKTARVLQFPRIS